METMQTEGFRKAPLLLAQPKAPEPRAHNPRFELGDATRATLRLWSAGEDDRRRKRAQIVLLSAEGLPPDEVSKRLGIAPPTTYKWLRRFARAGLAGLSDLPRSGQPHRLSQATRAEILRVTRDELPPKGGRWTIRVAARQLGVTQHQIRQVWSDAGYKPHDQKSRVPSVEA